MNGVIARRLARLQAAHRRRGPTAPAWDFSALSLEEQYELYLLLEGTEPDRLGSASRALTPAERRRRDDLMARARPLGRER